ncbi:hypothetical protein [Haloactinomyces albus]|uniref:Uncharacterized protein n=1 Tax=Haloactinomyces albus TaxID=1352928 RepID=A0AAE3ZK67_9ACTN|nr:hypothetical protein [Haloactinomyces albus]MDR7304657.1 hypothetical protein [Haloactinomyces albus]
MISADSDLCPAIRSVRRIDPQAEHSWWGQGVRHKLDRAIPAVGQPVTEHMNVQRGVEAQFPQEVPDTAAEL